MFHVPLYIARATLNHIQAIDFHPTDFRGFKTDPVLPYLRRHSPFLPSCIFMNVLGITIYLKY